MMNSRAELSAQSRRRLRGMRALPLETYAKETNSGYFAAGKRECNFNIPSNLDDPKIKDDLLIIKNDNQHESEVSMKEVLDILEDNV